MSAIAAEVRFPVDLPGCCGANRLRLPRPVDAFVEVRGDSRGFYWRLGLDEWFVNVGVSWAGAEEALAEAVCSHVSGELNDFEQVVAVLKAHGIHLDQDGMAWVGQQDLVVATLGSDLNGAAGRETISDAHSLLEMADAAAGDLEHIVGPLVSEPDADDEWHQDVLDAWPDAYVTQAVILLRAVHITPVMRGHHLGAWTAAQSIALFDQGASLVATKAAPLDKRDAIPDLHQDQRDLTPEQATHWQAEQDRLAHQWQAQLGLVPLQSTPTVLTWHTSYRNEIIDGTLSQWS